MNERIVNSLAQIIRDTLPLTQALTPMEEIAARKHGIPTFRGVLFKQCTDSKGNSIFKKVNENTVVLGGAILALQKLFGNRPIYIPQTINELEDINNDPSVSNESTHIRLFGVGTGGSGLTFGDTLDPDFKMKELPEWIPFRISDTDSLPADDPRSGMYYFRKQISEDPAPQWAWYLKEFENEVNPTSRWKDVPDPNDDGTLIETDVSGSDSPNLIECYGECLLKLEEEDLRPYFQWAGNLKMARYNSIGLFTGIKRQIAPGYTDYVGVRLFSVVNFSNVPLDLPSEATYLYRVYAAI